jgi:hypothetical protein
MTARQKLLVATTVALALGLGTFEIRQAARLQDRLAAAEQSATQARLATARRLADLTDENTRLLAETERLRADALAATQARAADATSALDPSLRAMADWLERVQTLKARLQAHPEIAIPEQWLTEEDWLDAAKDNPLAKETDFRRAASRLRNAADGYFTQKAYPALQRYAKAHDGKFPADIAQLQPYFEPPIDPALLQRWAVKPAKAAPGIKLGGDWVITQKSSVDEEMDQHTAISATGFGSYGNSFDPDAQKLEAVATAFVAATGRAPKSMAELLPYATTPEQKAALRRQMETPSPVDMPEMEILQALATTFAAAHPGRTSVGMEDLLPYATTPAQKAALQKVIAAQKSLNAK